MKATRFPYFSLNSKAIVANVLSTQVMYESNLNSLLGDSAMSSALVFCFYNYFIPTQKKKITFEEQVV